MEEGGVGWGWRRGRMEQKDGCEEEMPKFKIEKTALLSGQIFEAFWHKMYSANTCSLPGIWGTLCVIAVTFVIVNAFYGSEIVRNRYGRWWWYMTWLITHSAGSHIFMGQFCTEIFFDWSADCTAVLKREVAMVGGKKLQPLYCTYWGRFCLQNTLGDIILDTDCVLSNCLTKSSTKYMQIASTNLIKATAHICLAFSWSNLRPAVILICKTCQNVLRENACYKFHETGACLLFSLFVLAYIGGFAHVNTVYLLF